MSADEERKRRLTRRDFLRLGGLTATGALAASCAPGTATPTAAPEMAAEVEGATPEERALALIDRLKEDGRVSEGDTFTIMHHSGQRNQIVPALEEWNELTGLNFVSSEVGSEPDIYTKVMNEATVRSGDFDIFLTFVNWIADFAESGVILDQTNWWDAYQPEITTGDAPYVQPLGAFTSLYKGRRYSMGADNDTFSMFFRKDLVDDPEDLPQTWEEFDQWIADHHEVEEGVHGLHMYGTRFFAYTSWAPRFVSKGGAYFDDNMNPLIVSDEGVAALEEMKNLVDNYMWPDAVSGDWTAAYSRFPEGSVFCAWAWASLGQFAENPDESNVVGNVGAMPIPGTEHDGIGLVRAVPHVVGWSYSISRYGTSPEAAYAFIQWFCGPDKGLENLLRTGTLDPFRRPWFDDSGMREDYGEDLLTVLLDMTGQAFPDISLRGANEYLDNLNLNLQQAFGGEKDIEQALQDTADEWQSITDRLGRGLQIEAWREERQTYPQQIQDVWAERGLFSS